MRGAAWLCMAAAVAVAEGGTVSNVALRRTRAGSVVVAQDANVANELHNGEFVYVGMSYGECVYKACQNQSFGACGFGNGRFLVWTSPTLADGSWSEPIEILPADVRPAGIYFRPHLIYNKATQRWVLWVRYLPPLAPTLGQEPTGYIVATSPSLSEPFEIVNHNVTMHYANSADDNLFVDDDGTAYIAHTARATGTKIVVEQLTANYTACLGAEDARYRSEEIGPGQTEAPAMFKRNGKYYCLISRNCCYCSGGAEVLAYVSDSPLGPFTAAGSLGNAAGAQQNFVFTHPKLANGTVLWAGTRWGSDPAQTPTRPPIFDHSLQFWGLLKFNSDGAPAPYVWEDEITIPLA
eukprot:TRINITY_DN3612_c0_g3_i1.p1 TRINITY_DN3612_c0_g3~~TRINITY_DN3612_c0_g3_i1.p1  ORF type:complete len:351 (+),score=101.00 TRINITY_DN3612_c0_g3_i1:72-1124(+)